MDILPLGRLVRLLPPRRQRLLRRVGRNQRITAAANQVASARLEQCFPNLELILGFEELRQRPLQLAVV
jgi:hypothetical protein